jgi:restriction endonuclease S subunit
MANQGRKKPIFAFEMKNGKLIITVESPKGEPTLEEIIAEAEDALRERNRQAEYMPNLRREAERIQQEQNLSEALELLPPSLFERLLFDRPLTLTKYKKNNPPDYINVRVGDIVETTRRHDKECGSELKLKTAQVVALYTSQNDAETIATLRLEDGTLYNINAIWLQKRRWWR